MKKFYIYVLSLFALGLFQGFTNSDSPDNNPAFSYGYVPYYSDNFPAPNDTADLWARGYSLYLNGTFAGGIPPNFWRTGITDVFEALNGNPDDYVSGLYQSGGSFGDIDNWLVLPDLDVAAGDSISFFSRSPEGSDRADSIRVMLNPTNNTSPNNPDWIELGRFKVNTDGEWQKIGFEAPVSGLSARFAIRYCVADGGLFGNNSDYIGIDSLVVSGNGVLPVELASFTSVILNNAVTLNWSTSSERNNSGFEIERCIMGQWTGTGFVNGNGTTNSLSIYSFTDKNLNSGKYNYRLKQIDYNGNFEYFDLINEVSVGTPGQYELLQNYPNPFNPATTIAYRLPADGEVKISVYDNSGKEISSLVSGFKPAGYYSVSFNAPSLSSGVYFYSIKSGNFSSVKKMVLVK